MHAHTKRWIAAMGVTFAVDAALGAGFATWSATVHVGYVPMDDWDPHRTGPLAVLNRPGGPEFIVGSDWIGYVGQGDLRIEDAVTFEQALHAEVTRGLACLLDPDAAPCTDIPDLALLLIPHLNRRYVPCATTYACRSPKWAFCARLDSQSPALGDRNGLYLNGPSLPGWHTHCWGPPEPSHVMLEGGVTVCQSHDGEIVARTVRDQMTCTVPSAGADP